MLNSKFNISKLIKISSVVLSVILVLLLIFINRGLASMADYIIEGAYFWTFLALVILELVCLFWCWRGLFRRGEYLVIPPLHDIEGRERFAAIFAKRMESNPHIKILLNTFRHRSSITAADIVEGKVQDEDLIGKEHNLDDKDPIPVEIETLLHTGLDIKSDSFHKHGLVYLDYLANKEIKKNAQRIFAATALSQNGRIDALIVFVCLCRLIWRISCIYNQRPHPKEFISLYWAVVSSTFIALSLEELDLSSEIAISFGESFQAVAPAAGTASIPFVGSSLQLFTSSVADGAANGYLALRAGIITRNAYSYTARLEERPSRASVYKEAGAMLFTLSQSMIDSLVKAISSKLYTLPSYAVGKTVQVGKGVATGLSKAGGSVMDTVENGALATVNGSKKIINGAAQQAENAVNTVTGTAKKIGSSGAETVHKIGSIAGGAAYKLTTSAQGAAQKVTKSARQGIVGGIQFSKITSIKVVQNASYLLKTPWSKVVKPSKKNRVNEIKSDDASEDNKSKDE